MARYVSRLRSFFAHIQEPRPFGDTDDSLEVSITLYRFTPLPNKWQVAALKQGAIGQTAVDAERTSVDSIDVAAWEEKLAQSRKEQNDSSEKKIADLEGIHQRAIEVWKFHI